MERVLPTIADIVDRHAERTVFTRFITPNSPEQAPGQWRPYFQRWKIATRQMLGASQLDLVPELARFVPPATVIDKPTYSAFFRSPLANFLGQKHVRTVIVSGAETDVCVLSTVMDAVNIGFRVIIVEDALCSSSDAGHDALLTMYRMRFNEQIDLVTAERPARHLAPRPRMNRDLYLLAMSCVGSGIAEPYPVQNLSNRSVNPPMARPAATSLAQCASNTIRVRTSPAPSDQSRLRFPRGSTVAADASGPICMAWRDGKASSRLPEKGTPCKWPRMVRRSGRC